MTRIPVRRVWQNIVNYYYDNIERGGSDYSIWEWVEVEYNGKRQYAGRGVPNNRLDHDFVFDSDTDATAFKLKFMQYKLA